MPSERSDRLIMFSIIGLVAWAIVGLPVYREFFDPNSWLTKEAAGFFTFLLVVVGSAQLVMFGVQLWLIRESLVSVQNTAENQLRAYVYVENAWYEFLPGLAGACTITFRVKNFGYTPAHRVRMLSAVEVVDWNGGSPIIPAVPTRNEESYGSMAPHGDLVDSDVATVEFAPASSANRIVYLVGMLSYETVFSSRRRTTSFRYCIGGSDARPDQDKLKGEMTIDAEGNDAT